MVFGRQVLLAHQLDFELDSAQFRLDVHARARRLVLQHREPDLLEVGGRLANQVAVEHEQIGTAESGAYQRVIGVRAHEQFVQIDRVDEQIEQHGAARLELAALELGQIAQHDVARGVLAIHRGDLLVDQVAITLVEVVIQIVELGAREQIVGAREHAFGQRLLFDAVHHPAAHEGRPVGVPEAAHQNPRRVDERLHRREMLFQRHDHHEQRGKADLRPAVAIHDDQGQQKGERHHGAPQRHRVDRGESGGERGEEPDHRARQHFVVLVLERARHVDHTCAERAGGDREAELAIVKHDQAQYGR